MPWWSPTRRRGSGRARGAVATLTVLSFVVAGLVAASGPAGATVGSDQANITQLEQKIAAEGAQAQVLVGRFNEAQARAYAIDAQIAHDQRLVAADKVVESAATDTLRRLAIKAYVSGSGMDSPVLTMLGGTSNIATLLEQNQYLGAVGDKQSAALTALRLARARTQDDQRGLSSEQAQAKRTVAELTAAHDAATAAINADEAKLTSVKGNLSSLLAAASARRHAEQVAAERALAAAAQSPRSAPLVLSPAVSARSASGVSPGLTSPPPPPVSPSSSSGYANPFRDVAGLSPERIDQGVDYAGFGPVYAIGNGVVLNTVGSGWPGGTFIAYQLSDGPARGLVVYVAEDVEPSVQVGATVTSGTVLGRMYAGPTGIETGWANGSRLPDTMARSYGQFDGGNSSAFGYNFSRLLQSLGAPGGILNGSPNGTLPAAWPQW